jgi:uncharacterized membrane protein
MKSELHGLIMDDWFNGISEWTLGVVGILLLVGAAEVGAILARRHRAEDPEHADRFVSTLGAPTFGLLALMIAFTFAMALTRYEARVLEVVEAANAIGKAALRGRTLPEPYRSEVAPLFKRYLMLRVAHRGAQIASPEMAAANREALKIHEKLWDVATAAEASNPQVVPTGQFVDALNDMIDSYEKRISAGRNHVPSAIFVVLKGIAVIAIGFTAHGAHWGSTYIRWSMWLMSIMIGGVIMLIIDLDRPQTGFITVSQQPLLDLLDIMK